MEKQTQIVICIIPFNLSQDEQDRYNEKITFFEQLLETSQNRLNDERKSNSDLSNMVNSLKTDVEEKTKIIDELKIKLRTSSSENVAEMGIFY